MRILHAEGLELEPQREAHAGEMFAVLCDPALYEYENEPPASMEWLRERYRKLESRCSPDGREQWLNWVIRLPSAQLIGYVQATVQPDGRAAIAYVVGSEWWGRGLASRAVEAMIAELAANHGAHTVTAVFKRDNHRSRRLLERLGFAPATARLHALVEVEAGESLMQRDLAA
jgi:RimJ/RimL family protein N-acetyltransferase